MNVSSLKRCCALFMAVWMTGLLPACTSELQENDRKTVQYTAPALPTVAELTAPVYYEAPEPAVPDEQYTPENQLKLLADRDFDGATFLVIQEKGLENAIFPTSDELINVYADRRNRLVQEKYNVQLASLQMSAAQILNDLAVNAQSGVYFSDLLVVSPSLLKQLKEKKLIVSLDSLPFFETDSICISAEATEELNSDWSGIYGIWGDVLRQPTRQLCVFFNKNMARALNCGNFYAAAQRGSWDLDSLLNAAEAGKIAYDGSAADLIFASAGLVSTSAEGQALLSDSVYLTAVERLSQMLLPPVSTVDAGAVADGTGGDDEAGSGSDGTDARSRFMAGEALFYIGTLGDLSVFAHTEEAYGLLPVPKYTAAYNAYPVLTEQSGLPVLACPVNVASTAGTGIMLSALNAASCDEINDIFLQSAEQYVRDNGSALMLPYMIGSLRFDRRLIYGVE